MISNQISENSCDKNHDKPVPDYNIALQNRGFNYNIKYIPSQSKCQSRKRQIIWFNPLIMLMWKLVLVKFYETCW